MWQLRPKSVTEEERKQWNSVSKEQDKTVFLIYGKECVILLTACLKESISESRTTSSGNLFHKTMDIGKKENW